MTRKAKQTSQQKHLTQLMCLVPVVLFPVTAALAQQESWEKVVDDDQLSVWTRPRADSSYKEARGEVVINASAQKIFSVIVSAETCIHWVYSCVESHVISRPIPQDGIVYMRTNSLWPISDRDSVFYAKTFYNPERGEFKTEMEHRNDVLAPVEGVVRITAMRGSWTVTQISPDQSKVVFWSHVEPGGLLPAALVNLALSKLHSHSLNALREFIEAPLED